MADVNIFNKNDATVLESATLELNYMLGSGDVWYVLTDSLFYFYFKSTALFNSNGFLYTEILDEAGVAQASIDDTRDSKKASILEKGRNKSART